MMFHLWQCFRKPGLVGLRLGGDGDEKGDVGEGAARLCGFEAQEKEVLRPVKSPSD